MSALGDRTDNPYCSRCGDTRGGHYGHESSECTWRPNEVLVPYSEALRLAELYRDEALAHSLVTFLQYANDWSRAPWRARRRERRRARAATSILPLEQERAERLTAHGRELRYELSVPKGWT